MSLTRRIRTWSLAMKRPPETPRRTDRTDFLSADQTHRKRSQPAHRTDQMRSLRRCWRREDLGARTFSVFGVEISGEMRILDEMGGSGIRNGRSRHRNRSRRGYWSHHWWRCRRRRSGHRGLRNRLSCRHVEKIVSELLLHGIDRLNVFGLRFPGKERSMGSIPR